MQLLGDSTDKKLIKLIFGAPENFELAVKERGNNFFIKDERKTAVIFDKVDEVYHFYCN